MLVVLDGGSLPVLAPLSLSPMQILPDAVGLMRNIDNHYNGNTLYLYLSRETISVNNKNNTRPEYLSTAVKKARNSNSQVMDPPRTTKSCLLPSL